MHYDSEAGYGLFLCGDEGQTFVKKLAEREGLPKDAALACAGISALSHDNGYKAWDAAYLAKKSENDDTDGDAYFIYAQKQGGATKDADLYSSLDEMADEFRKEYGDCLPEDFDYTAHLCFLRASYVC